MMGFSRQYDQHYRGHLAAERAYAAGAVLEPNRWVGKSLAFRDGFESSWANLEFVTAYDRGETEFMPPIYGLCRTCDWPLEDDQPEFCRKCARQAAKTAARRGMLLRMVGSARNWCGLRKETGEQGLVRRGGPDGGVPGHPG